jgi:hypothetical protein
MSVVLDDSIPEIVKQKAGQQIKTWAREVTSLRFTIELTPPASNKVDFSMPLTRDDQPRLKIHLFKDGNGDTVVVSMDESDARLAREFIEKHHPDARAA